MARLRFMLGEEVLLDHRLRSARNTIGRADSCDIALPGSSVSRLHCSLKETQAGWLIEDRSRHGTKVNGRRIVGTELLQDGSRIEIGDYVALFVLHSPAARPTAPMEPDRRHEEVIGTVDGGVRVERAVLVVADGPGEGLRVVLRTTRTSVGGEGSQIVLPDPTLAPEHCFLRVCRGRVMIEPGRGPTQVDGMRVIDITPLYAEDTLVFGNTTARVEPDTQDEPVVSTHFGDMVAHSKAMRSMFGVLRRIASHPYPVLVIGESGTGKELIARGIHEHSGRSEKPFVALNCGGIRPELFESTLFGHQQGAFTGAERTTDGAFHTANGGTLFLDEVGELPEAMQASMLRVLETGEVRRVGGKDVTYPDVRIVAATNRDLLAEVGRGRFRKDLYFRLNVLSVDVPALRNRPSDIGYLAGHLLRQIHPEATLTEAAIAALATHSWPGNVRELKNVLMRAVVLSGYRIDAHDLVFQKVPDEPPAGPTLHQDPSAERELLSDVLLRCSNNRSLAARELGIARSTFLYRLRRAGLL